MNNYKHFLILTVLLMVGCSSESNTSIASDPCQEEADVAETVMDARLKRGDLPSATLSLAGNNQELREQLRPIIHDAFEYGRGGTATFERTKQMFRDKYYQQCMQRQGS